jgi:SAM-dependent methyltransferase
MRNNEEQVRRNYGSVALKVLGDEQGSGCCGDKKKVDIKQQDPISGELYEALQTDGIPEDAVLASLGCGNPTALAKLNPGETVLDLGSGGGIDVLLSAKRVGPTGHAYGLDFTDEMLQLAERNKAASGLDNVTFLRGSIEEIPLPDASVDVIISNCVINLSGDKDKVLAEAFRVLKPGGRFAVSDVVTEGELPDVIRHDMAALVGCVAGALDREEYVQKLETAGFIQASTEIERRYRVVDLERSLGLTEAIRNLSAEERESLDGRIMGAFIRATKPA